MAGRTKAGWMHRWDGGLLLAGGGTEAGGEVAVCGGWLALAVWSEAGRLEAGWMHLWDVGLLAGGGICSVDDVAAGGGWLAVAVWRWLVEQRRLAGCTVGM